MGGYSHRYWMCPYYTKDDRLKINCEGGTSIKFPDRKAITKFADDYCCAMPGWEKCSVAAMLNRHYDEMPSANIPKVYISGGGRENNRYLPQ